MEFQTSGSRRQFLTAIAKTVGAATMLRPCLGWAADITDPRVTGIVAATTGIDTHNHVDVPLTAAEMPGLRRHSADQCERWDQERIGLESGPRGL